MFKNTALALAAAALAATIGAAGAQSADGHAAHHPPAASDPGAPSGGMGAMMGGGAMTGGDMGRMMEIMRAGGTAMAPFSHVEGRIAFLKAELAVTDAQAPQWNAFADAYHANAKAMRDSMAGMIQANQPANAADRSDAMVTMMSARVDGLKAVAAAEKALYAVLTNSQKATADELLGGPVMGIGGCPMGGKST